LPRHIIALMFASDATQLTSFGDTSLWPLYMIFGNESKYRRCKPTLHLCHHVAYFRKVRRSSVYSLLSSLTCSQLPDEFKSFAAMHTGGKGPTSALMTHCHRELLHAQWRIILDDEFMDAYEHGVIIQCADGLQ
jgi:hypothetical protein